MQLLAAKFNQIATAIDATNAQIAALQAHLSELQEHQQQLLSVEQACQSALAQADTALMMLGHVDPSQVEIFRDAMAAKFTHSAVVILEPTPEPDAPTAPEPAPDAPVGDVTEPEADAPIDVEVSATLEPDAPTAPEPAPDLDIEQALAKMPLPSLRSLAKAKSVDARGTRANIARRLKALVTEFDIRALG
jgi:outer membrane murein-binding lipoprotein Lpp